MPSHKCKDMHEVIRMSQMLRDYGLAPTLKGLTLTLRCHLKVDKERWQHALSRVRGQDVIRKAAESNSMMEKQEELI